MERADEKPPLSAQGSTEPDSKPPLTRPGAQTLAEGSEAVVLLLANNTGDVLVANVVCVVVV